MTMNTRLFYLYRDARNNKAYNDIVFTGTDTAARYRRLLDSLPADEAGNQRFVPEQIGLPSLRHELPGCSDDTNWHEITGTEHTSGPPTRSEPFASFIARCLMVSRWDPEPRIAHGTIIFDSGFHHPVWPSPDDADVPLADCWLRLGTFADALIAARRDTSDGLPVPPTRPIDDVPATGHLTYRVRVHPASPELIYVGLPTPGQIVITAEQIRRWTRYALNEDELRELSRLIPGSSIPGAIRTIVTRAMVTHTFPGATRAGWFHRRIRRLRSPGIAGARH